MVNKISAKDLENQILDKYEGDIQAIIAKLEELSVARSKNSKSKSKLNTPVVVELIDASKKYKIGRQKIEALKQVNISIQEGEFVALTGPSGSGKSTLLQLIGALDKPSEGVVRVNNQNIAKLSDRKLSIFRNKTVGFVFQFFYLQPFLNVKVNLEVPAMFARTKRKDRQEKAAKLAEKVSLSDRLSHLPKELSGGQMQRAAIARALMNNPKIILADEPTGNLDRKNAFAIMDLFDAIRQEFGTTIIVVTHDAVLASRADREIRLQDGKVL